VAQRTEDTDSQQRDEVSQFLTLLRSMLSYRIDRQACHSVLCHKRVAQRWPVRDVAGVPSARQIKGQASSAKSVKLEDVDWDNVDWDTYDWRDYVDDVPGPAFQHTQQALEWETVCTHISSFASTYVGKKQCQNLEIARNLDRALVCSACVLATL